jgi:arabinogalactan oligomer/maltooligosaccharide transport system permease protein
MADAEVLPAPATRARERVETAPGPFRRWFRGVGWRHVVAVAAVLFALYPVAWVVSASFNPTGRLSNQKLIPSHASLTNYTRVLNSEAQPFKSWFVNTMVIAGVSAAAITMNSALAAYAFSRMRFRGRRAGLLSLLLIQMFPANLAVVALFLLLVSLGDVVPALAPGQKWGLIIVYVGTGLGVNVWLMKGVFDTIPISLDESARVDGASHFQVFFQIILPLVAPILAVVALISFVFIQNDVILASVMLQKKPDLTLAVGLFRLVADRYEARWGLFAAGAMMGGAPVVALWFALQRYIVSGLTAGSVKG